MTNNTNTNNSPDFFNDSFPEWGWDDQNSNTPQETTPTPPSNQPSVDPEKPVDPNLDYLENIPIRENIDFEKGETPEGYIKGENEEGESWTTAVYGESSFTIEGLFPTPLGIFEIPQVLMDITVPFLDQQKMLGEESEHDISFSGKISENKYILDEQVSGGLKEFILKQVNLFGKEIMKLAIDDFKITQSWITHKSSGEQHEGHSHSNSFISGVIFYGEKKDNTSPICFTKAQTSQNTFILSEGSNDGVEHNEFSGREFFVNYKPGTLILFPSYLRHYVPVNNTDIVRKSLSFNVISDKSIGKFFNLNLLEI